MPVPLWPPVLEIHTSHGVAAFYWDGDPSSVIEGVIKRTSIRLNELESVSQEIGRPLRNPAIPQGATPGECPEQEPGSSGGGESAAERSSNPVIGYRLSISTSEGFVLPFAAAHALMQLEPTNVIPLLRENLTNRTEERRWAGLFVSGDPQLSRVSWQPESHEEYYSLEGLDLVTILEEV